MYVKKSYQNDPLFQDTKIVFSVYDNEFKDALNPEFKNKAVFKGVSDDDLMHLSDPTFVNLHKHAISHSDAVIFGSEAINPEIQSFVSETQIPTLNYHSEETYLDAYSEFYDTILD
jgi:starch synthase